MKLLKTLLKRTVTLALVVTAGYYGWTYYQDRLAAEEQQDLGEVPTEPAAVKDITVSVSATGTLRPVRIVDVKSKAAGEIVHMPVELGDRVDTGDLIAQVDTETLEQEMAQAEADLDSAQIRYDVTQRQYERAQSLQQQDLVSQQDLDTSEQNYTQAKAQLLRAQAEIKLRQERLDDATVQAPSPGTIITKNVEEGTIIQSSVNSVQGGTTLVQMADLSTLEVRTLVDEIDIGRVQPGLPVEITVEAFPERKFNGKVIKIEPQAVVQQQVTTFPVLSRIDNGEGLLRLGMNANVDVIIHRRPHVLTVPNEGVKSVSDAGQVAQLLGIEYDRAAMRPGGDNLAAASPRRANARGAAFADTPRSGAGGNDGAPAGTPGVAVEADAGAGDRPISELTTEEIRQRMQGMPREKMGEFMRQLTDKQRQALRSAFQRRSGGAGGRSDGGRPGGGDFGGGDKTARGGGASMDAFGIGQDPKPGIVFVLDDLGQMKPRMVMTGVQDWENTEIISGLQAGDEVVLLPSTSLLMSQQALRDRFSRFRSLPGTGGGGRR